MPEFVAPEPVAQDRERARVATGDELAALLHHPSADVLLALSPAVPAELKRNAEEQLLMRLPQIPLGQKITLARRGPGRVAGALLTEGHPQVLAVVLDNPYLTEAQVLKALSRQKLPPGVVTAIIHHRKWPTSTTIELPYFDSLMPP